MVLYINNYLGVIMPVPENIRKVERPINTVVVDTGNIGPRRYAVRESLAIKYIDKDHNPQPRNGKTIGYIYDGRFILKNAKTGENGPDCLSYGASALVHSFSSDLYEDLLKIFPIDESIRIIVLASLKVLKPNISNSRMKSLYDRTFISVFYKDATISANTISQFLNKLGQDSEKRRKFYRRRMLKVAQNHHVAIDGSLIQDTSIVNDLSAFSRKARVKGCKDVSLIYAYDIETCEPVCADIFPGNCIDASAYKNFITRNNITRGILVTDKGFPPSEIKDVLDKNPELHYLTPLKRNDSKITKYNMLNFDDAFINQGKSITCKKVKVSEKCYLYSYMDATRASYECSNFIANGVKNDNFNGDELARKKDLFGTIVFESDKDLTCQEAYQCFSDRWKIELVFRHYKNDLDLYTTNVQSDFSILGETFINLISTIITCRILEKFRITKLIDKSTYSEIMDDLSSAWRQVKSPEKPNRDDGCWIHTLKNVHEELELLGLSHVAFEKREKRQPGRKKTRPEFVGPKRPRGRPKKTIVP